MNYCTKCSSYYQTPGTCNCFAATQPIRVTPWYPTYPYPTWVPYTPTTPTITWTADGNGIGGTSLGLKITNNTGDMT